MDTPSQISQQEILNQLSRILSTPAFNNSALLSEFLKYIIGEKLASREKLLKEYTIGVAVLSKKANYDPQTDATVRIHAGRLRRAREAPAQAAAGCVSGCRPLHARAQAHRFRCGHDGSLRRTAVSGVERDSVAGGAGLVRE